MSGGSWDYLYERMEEAATRLAADASPERRALGRRMALMAKAMHDIEWVDSCDYGPGDDAKAIEAALGGQEAATVAALYELVEEARRVNVALEERIRSASTVAEQRK